MEKYINPTERTERIKAFQEKYIPSALRTKNKVNLLVSAGLEYFFSKEALVEGRENLPEKGPFMIVSNHFNLKETPILLAALKDHDAHVVASEKVHGEHPIRKLLVNVIRGLNSPSSLAHLSSEEKENLVARIPDTFIKEKYQDIVSAEECGEADTSGLLQFVRSSVALLSRGDVLVVYPEGLFLYDGVDGSSRKQELYKGYGGFELIASQYKKLTGEELPIIPTAVYVDDEGQKKAMFGEKLSIDAESEASLTDQCMRQVAKFLPKEQQGYYSSDLK
jgi:1-acyl-sn-glycerol-3-phosphate acyltransferase